MVRIIGGKYRGKQLPVPDIPGLRPTPDRVRETLFNWLMHDVRGARCLDAFAGTGAIGFEAYSRGAAFVKFLENAPAAVTNLKKQIAYFNSANLELVKTNAVEYFKHSQESFDIIFLDPPFATNILLEIIPVISQSDLLLQNGLLYTEATHAISLPEDTWQQLKQQRAGKIIYSLYKKCIK